MAGVPALELLAALPLPVILVFIGVVDVHDDEAGFKFQGLFEDHLAAPGPVARQGQIEALRPDVVLPQIRPQNPGVGRFEAGPPGHGVADDHDAIGARRPAPLEGLRLEAPAAGPEEVHRAVGPLVKARLGGVAVGEPPGNIRGKEDTGDELGCYQQQHHHQKGRGNEFFHSVSAIKLKVDKFPGLLRG